MTDQETPTNVIDFIPRKLAMESLERMKGVQGPERLLVGPAAQRVERQDGAEALREDSGVEPAAKQCKCPLCRGTGLHRALMRRVITEIGCPQCGGTGELRGRLETSQVWRRATISNHEYT